MLPANTITSFEHTEGLTFGSMICSENYQQISDTLTSFFREFTEIPKTDEKSYAPPCGTAEEDHCSDEVFDNILRAMCTKLGFEQETIDLLQDSVWNDTTSGICIGLSLFHNEAFNLYNQHNFTKEETISLNICQERTGSGFILKEVNLYELIATIISQNELRSFSLLHWFKIQDSYFMILNFAGIDLYNQVNTLDANVKDDYQFVLIRIIEEAVRNGIIPGDAKLKNTLIKFDTPKMIDFGTCLFSQPLLTAHANLFAQFNISADWINHDNANSSQLGTYTMFNEIETQKIKNAQVDQQIIFNYFVEMFILMIFGFLGRNTDAAKNESLRYFYYDKLSATKRFDFFWTILFGAQETYPVDYSNFDQLSQDFLTGLQNYDDSFFIYLKQFYTSDRLKQIIAKMGEVIKTQQNAEISGYDLCPDVLSFPL